MAKALLYELGKSASSSRALCRRIMTEYIYFASYQYLEIIPPLTVWRAGVHITRDVSLPSRRSGTGNARITATQPITTWDDIEAMEKAIVEMHPEYESVIVTNYKLLNAA